jgi:hypothetical protein
MTTARLAFAFVDLGFAVCGLAALRAFVRVAVRLVAFLTVLLGFAARRREPDFLPAAFAERRFFLAGFLAAFVFTGRAFRRLGLDRTFFPDFLAMVPPVRSN